MGFEHVHRLLKRTLDPGWIGWLQAGSD
jgi:hypothetical protein